MRPGSVPQSVRGVARRARSAAGDALGGALTFLSENVLLVAFATMALALIALFFIGLSVIAPHSSGQEIPLSRATTLINGGYVRRASLLDEDSQLELTTTTGTQVWAAYPGADSFTGELLVVL